MSFKKLKCTFKNYVAKNAIIEWLDTFYLVRKQGMMILGKPLLSNLLKIADSEKLESFAKATAERKADLLQLIIGKHLNNDVLEDFIKQTPKLLGSSGLMWFNYI